MYLIRYLDNYQIIRIAFFGSFSGTENTAVMMRKLAETAEAHGCERFLFDMRNTQIADTYVELFHLSINESILSFKKQYKAAVLFSQEEESNDEKKYRWLELIMKDRAYQLQVFQNENSALIWLNQKIQK